MELTLSTEDQELLIELLAAELGGLRSEVRRTRNPSFHDQLVAQEARLKSLLERLRALPSANPPAECATTRA